MIADRLAVSNIAWDAAEDDAVAALLVREGVRGVEIAPTKWRSDPYAAQTSDIRALRSWWADRGLRVVSLQSLLFGRPELRLFGSKKEQSDLADYLISAFDFAAEAGAHALVFGSPKNRVRGALTEQQACDIAVPFFRALGEHASTRGVSLCLEANPAEYGCDFLTTTAEAVALCRAIDHLGIRVNGDLGGMAMNGEDAAASLREAGDLLGHVHVSEPNLAEISAAPRHREAASALKEIEYPNWISIEMRASGERQNLAALERAIRNVKASYAG